ncbi:hypothetical protein DRO58_03635 [Candidatus Bathyarchaeota archaeon]|nr:MAG: hypothetical protein DRO58_03635 [Candidatus Bathyarchaeota archaeon]
MYGRIAVLDKPFGEFKVQEIPVPEPKRGELLVRQVMCGVCGTDVHIYQGRLPDVKYPLVLGHEIIGTIEKLGEGVNRDHTGREVEEGDLIYVIPALRCRRCYFCLDLRQPNLCMDGTAYGFNPYPDEPPGFYGGYGEFLYMRHPNSEFLKIDAKPEAAVFLEPLTIGIHAVSRVEIHVGDVVVVQGAGAIGLSALIAAKEKGAFKMIVIGAPKSRLELAKEFGADLTIDIEEIEDPKERVEIVKSETRGGYGADVVIECTGFPSAVPEGIDMVRRGGFYAVAGHFTDAGPVMINPYSAFTRKHINLVGVWSSRLEDFIRGRPIIESGRYPIEKIVSHKLPLERCKDAMEAMIEGYRLDGKEVRKIVIQGGL